MFSRGIDKPTFLLCIDRFLVNTVLALFKPSIIQLQANLHYPREFKDQGHVIRDDSEECDSDKWEPALLKINVIRAACCAAHVFNTLQTRAHERCVMGRLCSLHLSVPVDSCRFHTSDSTKGVCPSTVRALSPMSRIQRLLTYAKAKLTRHIVHRWTIKTFLNALWGHAFIDLKLLDQKLPFQPASNLPLEINVLGMPFSLFLWLKCYDPFSCSSQQSRGDIHL